MSIDTQVAEQFGEAVAIGDFAAAHALLTKRAQQAHSVQAMKQQVADMTAYADAPIRYVEVMSDLALEDWPDKRDADLAWVYVALSGDSFSEGAYVLLITTDDGIRIGEVEWGRP